LRSRSQLRILNPRVNIGWFSAVEYGSISVVINIEEYRARQAR
jgi:hypothetical protein